MKTLRARVVGQAPGLLSNNYAGMLTQVSTPGGKSRKDIPTPEREAADGAYRDANGHLAFPTASFCRALVDAGKGRKIGRTGLNTILGATVFPATELMTLEHPETHEPLDEYVVDVRRAVPPGQGAVLRARPLIMPWSAVVELEYEDLDVDEESVLWALERAGRTVGIGNYRPQKRGPYGRFTVEGQE